MAEKLLPLIPTHRYGIYHMTSTGECTCYDLVAKNFALPSLRTELRLATSAACGAKARRPSYSVLDN